MNMLKETLICMLCFTNINSNEIDTAVESVCGGVRNCSSVVDTDSCCRPCECGDICYEKNTCCHDNHATMSVNVTKQMCMASVSYAKTSTDRRKFAKYFVRSKCPEGYPKNLTRWRCEMEMPKSVSDIPFVSSADGSVIYKNRHCAACFGEVNFILWRIEIDWLCMKMFFLDIHVGNLMSMNKTYLTQTLSTMCTLLFKRPTITSWKSTVCFERNEVISSCPEESFSNTGFQSSVYDELKDKCENVGNSFTFFNRNGYFPYANVFCSLCNQGNVPETCDMEDPIRVTRELSFLLKIEPLIDVKADEGRTCAPHEYEDQFFGVCRILQCPIFHMARRGKCVSLIIRGSSKLNFLFHFKISLNGQRQINDNETFGFARSLSHILQHSLKFQHCHVCSITVKKEINGTEIYSKIIFTTTSKCLEEEILSTAARLQENQMLNTYQFIKWNRLVFRVEYIASSETYRNLTQNTLSIYTYVMTKCKYFFSSKLENCPKIIFTTKEYHVLEKANDLRSVIIAKLKKEDIEMCVSDYEAITSNNVNVFFSNNVVTIVLFALAFFQLVL